MSYAIIEGDTSGPYRTCEWTNHPGTPDFDLADLAWCSQFSVGLGADGRAYCAEHMPEPPR